MKSISRAAAAALVVVAMASPSWAGEVRLEIRDGLVTLNAKDATVREVLAEWSRVGQTRVLNADRVPSGPVTLELNGVPEAKALDILLRSVAGYLAAPRAVATAAASRYDRIVIMPMPRPAAGTPSPATSTVSTPPQPYEQRRMYQPQPSLMVDDQDEPVVQPQGQPRPAYATPGASQPGTMTQPMPQYPQGQQPTGQPGVAQPGMTQPGMMQPGMAQPNAPGTMPQSPAAQRPGTMTAPGKPPGPPGGPGGPGGI